VLEFGCPRDEEAIEQVASVELECVRVAARFDGVIECSHVAPEIRMAEADLVIAATLERAVAEGTT